MPIQVPRYEPQVGMSKEPNVQVTQSAPLSSFGGGQGLAQVGGELSKLGDTVAKVHDQERQMANQMVVDEFNSKLTQAKNKLIFDPENGLMARRGKDAFGAPEEFDERYKKEVEGLQGMLSNDEQRFMAQKLINNHKDDLDGNIQRHVFGETKRYDDESTKASIDAAKDDAVYNFQMPGKVQESLKAQHDLIVRYGQRNGLSEQDPQLQAMLKDAVAKTHSGVIDRMLATGDDLKAQHYFDQIKGDIHDKETLVGLEKALEEGSIRGESQRLTEKFMAGHSMAQALEAAKNIENPKLKDATRDRIQREFALQETARRDSQEKYHMKALNILDQSKGDIDLVMKDPSWRSLDQGARDGLMRYARLKAEGGSPSTDWNEFYNLKTLASVPDTRQKFLQTNLMEYRNKMADPEFKQLIDLQTSLRKGDGKAASHLDGFRSDQEIVNSVLADAGFDLRAKPGTDEVKAVNLFKAAVDKEVMKAQQRSGKKVTNDEIKRIADNLMVQGRTDDGIFGSGYFASKKRIFEIDPNVDQKFVIEVSSIPRDEKQKIETALKKHGLQINEQNILQLYKRKIGGLTNGQ